MDSATSLTPSSDESHTPGSNLFADIRENVKRCQEDVLGKHLRVDPGANVSGVVYYWLECFSLTVIRSIKTRRKRCLQQNYLPKTGESLCKGRQH